MRSNRKLIRKCRKILLRCAILDSRRQMVPIFRPMWMNWEIIRMAEKIRQQTLDKRRKGR